MRAKFYHSKDTVPWWDTTNAGVDRHSTGRRESAYVSAAKYCLVRVQRDVGTLQTIDVAPGL